MRTVAINCRLAHLQAIRSVRVPVGAAGPEIVAGLMAAAEHRRDLSGNLADRPAGCCHRFIPALTTFTGLSSYSSGGSCDIVECLYAGARVIASASCIPAPADSALAAAQLMVRDDHRTLILQFRRDLRRSHCGWWTDSGSTVGCSWAIRPLEIRRHQQTSRS